MNTEKLRVFISIAIDQISASNSSANIIMRRLALHNGQTVEELKETARLFFYYTPSLIEDYVEMNIPYQIC